MAKIEFYKQLKLDKTYKKSKRHVKVESLASIKSKNLMIHIRSYKKVFLIFNHIGSKEKKILDVLKVFIETCGLSNRNSIMN